MDEGKITLSTSESISSQLCEEILSLMSFIPLYISVTAARDRSSGVEEFTCNSTKG